MSVLLVIGTGAKQCVRRGERSEVEAVLGSQYDYSKNLKAESVA